MMKPHQWFASMREIWITKQPDSIAGLLGSPFEYYENPAQPPLTSITDVVKEWQVIKSQNIEFVEIKMLHETEHVGVALWRYKEAGRNEHAGVYYLELDDNGKCNQFRQWWHEVL